MITSVAAAPLPSKMCHASLPQKTGVSGLFPLAFLDSTCPASKGCKMKSKRSVACLFALCIAKWP